MTLAPLFCGFVAFCCFGDQPDRPPPLTFEKHVDYIVWCNDLFSRGKTENALPIFERLCPDEAGNDGKDDGGRHGPTWGKGGSDFVFWPRPSRPPQRP